MERKVVTPQLIQDIISAIIWWKRWQKNCQAEWSAPGCKLRVTHIIIVKTLHDITPRWIKYMTTRIYEEQCLKFSRFLQETCKHRINKIFSINFNSTITAFFFCSKSNNRAIRRRKRQLFSHLSPWEKTISSSYKIFKWTNFVNSSCYTIRNN